MNRNKTRKKGGAPLIIAVVLVAVFAFGGYILWSGGIAGSGGPISVPTTPVVTSNVARDLEAYRGRVVVLNFWATWCGPCRMEIPDFVQLQHEYRDRGLEFIGVSLDPITPGRGGAAAVAPFMKNYSINYAIWMVNDQSALGSFDVSRGIPTTYILNRNGQVVRSYVGARPRSVFETDIKQLL